MTGDRCKHELITEQCADCRSLPPLPPKWSVPLTELVQPGGGASSPFPAAFESDCAGCGFSISPGDTIRMQAGEAVHDGCEDT